jgi:hypothetical protein
VLGLVSNDTANTGDEGSDSEPEAGTEEQPPKAIVMLEYPPAFKLAITYVPPTVEVIAEGPIGLPPSK